MNGWKFSGPSLVCAMLAAAAVASAQPVDPGRQAAPVKPVRAAGGYNDSFHINMGPGKCNVLGVISFIDHGPGKGGNGKSNDDYVEIWDTCGNKHGVKGWAWLDGKLKGEKYHGKGEGRKIVWDPLGNVKRNVLIGLKICEVDGPNDRTPGPCNWGSHRSVDG